MAAVTVLFATACGREYDDATLRAVVPAVDAPCDADGVELEYDVEYFPSDGEHVLRSIEVRGLDPACAGSTVRVEVRGVERRLAGGSAAAPAGGEARVLFDPVTEVLGADGETFLQSNLDVRADDVRGVSVTVD